MRHKVQDRRFRKIASFGVILIVATLSSFGCSGLVTGMVADALTGTGGSFAKEEDPDLMGEAAPFALKTMEALLERKPNHLGLLTSLTSGFTQYSFAFVEEKADEISDEDYEAAEKLEARAYRLYLRARDYGLRGLHVRHKNFLDRLRTSPEALAADLDAKKDLPLLYWTAAAWGASISASGMSPAAIVDFPVVEKLIEFASGLDPDWQDGSVYELMMSLEAAKPGGDLNLAEQYFNKAVSLSGGRRVGSFVSMAESICVPRQDLSCFRSNIEKALTIELENYPQDRLVNEVMRRRALRVKAQEADLILTTED